MDKKTKAPKIDDLEVFVADYFGSNMDKHTTRRDIDQRGNVGVGRVQLTHSGNENINAHIFVSVLKTRSGYRVEVSQDVTDYQKDTDHKVKRASIPVTFFDAEK